MRPKPCKVLIHIRDESGRMTERQVPGLVMSEPVEYAIQWRISASTGAMNPWTHRYWLIDVLVDGEREPRPIDSERVTVEHSVN